ncbi:MAG: radical SAM family heme chaperone HemW [Chitinophagaceae bacterium]|nr:radical SAM family heme chaperone HemW [Chitinophagaceae bacterium]
MIGIYLHIPFCKKACHYCNFHFSTSLQQKSNYLKALQLEIEGAELHQPWVKMNRQVGTIYLGGGTPSLLTPLELRAIFDTLKTNFDLNSATEITLEANPDDINRANLEAWLEAGINRLSIGIQSFRQQDLEWMNRAHTAEQAETCVSLAAAAGFRHFSLDLIYGQPGLSNTAWLNNLQKAHNLGVNHLSCYALTVEDKTALHHFVKKGQRLPPDEAMQAAHFNLLMNWAAQNGWEHYEISNLCQPGHRAKHNSAYWQGQPYLGFGASAHSFDGKYTRCAAVANNAVYIDYWLHGKGMPYEIEILNPLQRLHEQIMTGLRTSEGIYFSQSSGILAGTLLSTKTRQHVQKLIEKYLSAGLLMVVDDRIKLTSAGKFRADGIAADFFVEEI